MYNVASNLPKKQRINKWMDGFFVYKKWKHEFYYGIFKVF